MLKIARQECTAEFKVVSIKPGSEAGHRTASAWGACSLNPAWHGQACRKARNLLLQRADMLAPAI